MELADLSRLAAELESVTERRSGGLLDWRYRGRRVARQLDDTHVVIRASFEFRGFLLRSFPETFSVPPRYARSWFQNEGRREAQGAAEAARIEPRAERRRGRKPRRAPPAAWDAAAAGANQPQQALILKPAPGT